MLYLDVEIVWCFSALVDEVSVPVLGIVGDGRVAPGQPRWESDPDISSASLHLRVTSGWNNLIG